MMRRLIIAKNRKPRNFKHFCWRQFFLILDGLEALSLAWKSPIQFGSFHVGHWTFFKHSGRRQLYHLSADSSSLFVSSLEINSYLFIQKVRRATFSWKQNSARLYIVKDFIYFEKPTKIWRKLLFEITSSHQKQIGQFIK